MITKDCRGDPPPAKKIRIDTGGVCTSSAEGHELSSRTWGQDFYRQIDLDDLHDPETSAGIILDMQDRQRYFDARMSNSSTVNGAAKVGDAMECLLLEPYPLVIGFRYSCYHSWNQK